MAVLNRFDKATKQTKRALRKWTFHLFGFARIHSCVASSILPELIAQIKLISCENWDLK